MGKSEAEEYKTFCDNLVEESDKAKKAEEKDRKEADFKMRRFILDLEK